MSGVALAVGLGSAYVAGKEGDKNRAAAANQRPQFAKIVEPGIKRQLDRTEDTTRNVFSGDRVANFSDLQQQGLGQTQGLADSLQGFAGTSGQGFDQIASGSRIGNNPFLEQQLAGMRTNVNQNLMQNQLPAIQNNAIAGGGLGGSRQGIAQGLAIQGANRDILQAETTARSGQVNMDQAQQLQALLGQQQILQGQGGSQRALLAAGGIQQGQEQAEIGGVMQQFNEGQDMQFERDQQLLSILLGTPAQNQAIPQSTNPAAAGLGAALATSQLLGQGGGGGTQAPAVSPTFLPPGVSPTAGGGSPLLSPF